MPVQQTISHQTSWLAFSTIFGVYRPIGFFDYIRCTCICSLKSQVGPNVCPLCSTMYSFQITIRLPVWLFQPYVGCIYIAERVKIVICFWDLIQLSVLIFQPYFGVARYGPGWLTECSSSKKVKIFVRSAQQCTVSKLRSNFLLGFFGYIWHDIGLIYGPGAKFLSVSLCNAPFLRHNSTSCLAFSATRI